MKSAVLCGVTQTELKKYSFERINQIAGHNPVKEIEIIETENKEIVLIDMLERRRNS